MLHVTGIVGIFSNASAVNDDQVPRTHVAFRDAGRAGNPWNRAGDPTAGRGRSSRRETRRGVRYFEATVAARRLRPFARRRFRIARPDLVFIRSRKPCLRRRFDSTGLECPLHRGGSSLLLAAPVGFPARPQLGSRCASSRRRRPHRQAPAVEERIEPRIRVEIVGSGSTPDRPERANQGSNRPETVVPRTASGSRPARQRIGTGGRPGKRGILPARRRACQCSKQGFCQRNSRLVARTGGLALSRTDVESQRRGRVGTRACVLLCGQPAES